MKVPSHALEVMERYIEEHFNEEDQLGLWEQSVAYSTFKRDEFRKKRDQRLRDCNFEIGSEIKIGDTVRYIAQLEDGNTRAKTSFIVIATVKKRGETVMGATRKVPVATITIDDLDLHDNKKYYHRTGRTTTTVSISKLEKVY